MKQTLILLSIATFSVLSFGIPALANEPYVPGLPMIIGDDPRGASIVDFYPSSDLVGQSSPVSSVQLPENTEPVTIQKILTSSEIGKGADIGYDIFEKLRLKALEKIEAQKNTFQNQNTQIDFQKSPGLNAERGHDALLSFILLTGSFIFSHPLIAYILLVVVVLAVARAFF